MGQHQQAEAKPAPRRDNRLLELLRARRAYAARGTATGRRRRLEGAVASKVLGWPERYKLATHSWGDTAIKGCSLPNFWANLASFSLVPRQAVEGPEALRLAVDVKVILMLPCIFCIENH